MKHNFEYKFTPPPQAAAITPQRLQIFYNTPKSKGQINYLASAS